MPAFLDEWISIVGAIIVAIIGSSGLWGYIEQRKRRENRQDKLVKGLAQVIIALKANEYLMRGDISADEFSTLYNLIFSHYKDLGGNGSAERLMRRLENLPVRSNNDGPNQDGPTPPRRRNPKR